MNDPCGIVETIQTNMIEAVTAAASPLLDEASNLDEEDDNCNDDKKDENDDKNMDNKKENNGKEDIKDSTSDEKDEKEEVDSNNDDEGGLSKMATVSDLSDLSRKICVVTTAGLPWRTGTAVNPLARALYLTRGRTKHSVTLMIPWLETMDEQTKVFGSNVFNSPEEQKIWIQTYCRERILNNDINDESKDTNDEVDNLRISFYPAKYHNLFGSIFATVDICSLIPKDEADIAILEEPEHLTWFRSLPNGSSDSSKKTESVGCSVYQETETTTFATTIMDNNDSSCASFLKEDCNNDNNEREIQKVLEEQAIIGWTAKFSYVVGILHTNYSAYMKQYGLGTSIVTASALQALSSICVRAYTHRLIRLSDTLPELDKPKEITCNVHGVRSEFFVEDDGYGATAATAIVTDEEQKKQKQDSTTASSNNNHNIGSDDVDVSKLPEDDLLVPEPIYFIGKVIWAKGFDKLLEIEDLYRKKTGEYFPIDVYGSGGDFDAISRAFLGRGGLARVLSSESVKSIGSDSGTKSSLLGKSKSPVAANDKTAALLFSREGNLRGQIEDGETFPSDSLIVEVQTCETPVDSDTGTPSSARNVPKRGARDVMSHLKETTIETKTGVTKAFAALSARITKFGLHSLYSEHEQETVDNATGGSSSEEREGIKFRFDPPKSRYELRRHSVPARFLGVKDHALLRDIPQHKIFINLSITEVLCTTTAEALAMRKFVIIPEHPSNTFFLQFPNCLAYETKLECVEKIKFALENDPVRLSPEDKYKLTWEGANLRLYESSVMTNGEAKERNKKTGDLARLHMETMKTGAFFQGLIHRGHKQHSTDVNTERKEKQVCKPLL